MAVKFAQHVDIDAPPDLVWSLLTDPQKWPLWFEGMEGLSGLTTVSKGASFSWRKGGDTGTGMVLTHDEGKQIIGFAMREGDSERTHTFDVDRSGGFLGIGANDSRLRYTLEYDPPGGFLGDFVAGGNPADMLHVRNTLHKIRDLAQRMAKGK